LRNCPLAAWVKENKSKEHNIVFGRILWNFIMEVLKGFL
jgi:hypothetical protein